MMPETKWFVCPECGKKSCNVMWDSHTINRCQSICVAKLKDDADCSFHVCPCCTHESSAENIIRTTNIVNTHVEAEREYVKDFQSMARHYKEQLDAIGNILGAD